MGKGYPRCQEHWSLKNNDDSTVTRDDFETKCKHMYFVEHVHQEKPGFTAYVDGTFNAPGTIILPHVYSNFGSLYDPNTGVFTADRSGLYGFYLGIECVDTGLKIVELVRDGSRIAHAACFPQSGVPYYGSSFSVQHIEKGSKVWAIDAYDSGSSRIGLGGKTTLSGILIS